jgi:hypothetical protein
MNHLRQLLPFLLISPLVLFARSGDRWELAFDKDGTRVYTQLIADSPYKQVKVTTTIHAPLDKVVDILMAFTEYKTWMYQVQESYLINRSDKSHFVFIREDAAWPIQDRYQVARVEIERSFRTAQVEFHVVPNYIDKRTDAIQIRQCDGYWSLEARNEGECALEFVLVENPGGHVPAWLTNLQVAEKPFQTVSALKQLAERQVIRP